MRRRGEGRRDRKRAREIILERINAKSGETEASHPPKSQCMHVLSTTRLSRDKKIRQARGVLRAFASLATYREAPSELSQRADGGRQPTEKTWK